MHLQEDNCAIEFFNTTHTTSNILTICPTLDFDFKKGSFNFNNFNITAIIIIKVSKIVLIN